jgi:hypothetical protein
LEPNKEMKEGGGWMVKIQNSANNR